MFRLLTILFLLISSFVFSQKDTLRFKDGDIMVGHLKSYSTGLLVMKTKYSKQDFIVKFNRVSEISIDRKCLILLTGGGKRYGNIKSIEKGVVQITSVDGIVEEFPLNRVVGLQEVSDKFFDRFKGWIDFGYNLTKANNNAQLTASARLEYNGSKWLSQANANFLNSTRTDAAETSRTDANIDVQRLLKKNWFIVGNTYYLSNTEQALNSRINPGLGIGRWLISTNKLYLALSGGFTYNFESFTDSTAPRNSAEGFLGLNFNIFDIKDFNLTTGVRFFPSLTEDERIRIDYDIALKWDIIWNLYVKTEFKINYDNQPAVEGNQFDYIVTTGFGWKFND